MHPINLPEVREVGTEYGAIRVLIALLLYAILAVGVVVYLRHKLPRKDDDERYEDQ